MIHGPASPESRRTFLKNSALAAAIAITEVRGEKASNGQPTSQPHVPWYQRTYRWGQTNITEADVNRYDLQWWRKYWEQTATQGVIVNAGGIFAYYPSRFPLHHRAAGLRDRDLFGEIA